MLTFTPVNTLSQGDVANSQSAYGASQNAATAANQGLQDFQKTMQSGTDMYNQQFGISSQQAGYNPAQLAAAQDQVRKLQAISGNLPQAIQSKNANYGATAGDISSELSAEGQNLNSSLGQANTAAGQQENQLNAALTGAQNATTAGVQTQQQKLTGLQAISTAALQQMDEARQTMTQLEQLYQVQGQFNASEQAVYEQANASMVQAQAAATQANAQAAQIHQSIAQQNAINAAYQKQYGANYAGYENNSNFGKSTATPVAAQAPAPTQNNSGGGLNLSSIGQTAGGILGGGLGSILGLPGIAGGSYLGSKLGKLL